MGTPQKASRSKTRNVVITENNNCGIFEMYWDCQDLCIRFKLYKTISGGFGDGYLDDTPENHINSIYKIREQCKKQWGKEFEICLLTKKLKLELL